MPDHGGGASRAGRRPGRWPGTDGRSRAVLAAALATAAAGLLVWGALRLWAPPPRPGGNVVLSLAATLGGGDTAGYARALAPRPLEFPADHGPHPDFRTEWWYLTGNLEAVGGRRFGYQLTLFRSALAPEPGGGSGDDDGPADASSWRTRQAWMGHFALTDVQGGRHHAFERFARGAVGLAGARAAPFRVWIEDWALEGGAELLPLRLVAAEEGVAVELRLTPGKGVVLQGEEGLSRKGPGPGNASYYYSLPRLPTEGEVRLGTERIRVTGQSWLDREWSTSALPDGVVGWDWFALQLDDGRELMVYRLRRADGSPDPYSEGVLVEAGGGARRLDVDAVEIAVLGTWRSPASGVGYPAGWRLGVPGEGLVLEVQPVLADQEMDLAFRYWEGAVDVRGRWGSTPVTGRGYVELTGYGDGPAGARGTEGG